MMNRFETFKVTTGYTHNTKRMHAETSTAIITVIKCMTERGDF